jgi:excisionase family DNA binding protein
MDTVFVDHAAELLGVSRRTVYYWIRDGRLQTIRTPNGSQRVRIVSIETLLREEMEERARLGMRRRPGATVQA